MTSAKITLGNHEQYQRFSYPGGEMQVRFPDVALLQSVDVFTIVARITKPEDIIELALLRDAISGLFEKALVLPQVRLILPYLPYARADRRFTPGDCLGISVFARLLFALSFTSVTTLDAHSEESGKWIGKMWDVSPTPFIHQAILNFADLNKADRVTVLYPDEGALARYSLHSVIGNNAHQVDLDFLHCRKDRDAATGTLNGFDVPALPNQPAIIIDDICDGGGTFLGIAQKVGGRDLGLYVTHGIFSKGLGDLADFFQRIYCTDSFRSNWDAFDTNLLQVLPCLPSLMERKSK